mmetsp:Transcript_64105/g.179341  ORF Transcript_64105/g.179341 Transcript_64105/m.179341 type:complete len:86 (-) Transcript_64105:142-399(-)
MRRNSSDLNPPKSAGDMTASSDSGIPFLYAMMRQRAPLLETGTSNKIRFAVGEGLERPSEATKNTVASRNATLLQDNIVIIIVDV